MRLANVAALGAALVSLAIPHNAGAQVETLRFATTHVPQSPINVGFLRPWADKINEAAKGKIVIEIRDGQSFANPNNYFDRVMDDVAQIAWGIQPTIGKFPLSSVVALPYLATRSVSASTAFWRAYAEGIFGQEYADLQPLVLCALPQAGLHFRREVDPDNLRGLKIIGGTPIFSNFLGKVGATPLSIPIYDTYEALQRGTADGNIMQYTAFGIFKLAEVTRFHIDAQLGGAGGMIFMTKKRFEALSPEVRKILLDNSGEAATRTFGVWWDQENARGRQLVAGRDGQKIVSPTPQQEALWAKYASEVSADWAKSVPNGDKILAAFKKHLADVEAGK
jgi:TRAP-type transport system periplasmic protein